MKTRKTRDSLDSGSSSPTGRSTQKKSLRVDPKTRHVSIDSIVTIDRILNPANYLADALSSVKTDKEGQAVRLEPDEEAFIYVKQGKVVDKYGSEVPISVKLSSSRFKSVDSKADPHFQSMARIDSSENVDEKKVHISDIIQVTKSSESVTPSILDKKAIKPILKKDTSKGSLLAEDQETTDVTKVDSIDIEKGVVHFEGGGKIYKSGLISLTLDDMTEVELVLAKAGTPVKNRSMAEKVGTQPDVKLLEEDPFFVNEMSADDDLPIDPKLGLSSDHVTYLKNRSDVSIDFDYQVIMSRI